MSPKWIQWSGEKQVNLIGDGDFRAQSLREEQFQERVNSDYASRQRYRRTHKMLKDF